MSEQQQQKGNGKHRNIFEKFKVNNLINKSWFHC